MRAVHVLGLGLTIGMVALAAIIVVVTYQWQVLAYPATAQIPGVGQPGTRAGGPASSEVEAGRTVFRQKCSSCHTIGGGKLVGPDLKGITQQRPRDWLIRTIVEPDKLIASGDPTAAQLVQEYGVPMPPTGTSAQQAEQTLAYIEFQTSGASPAVVSSPLPTTKAAPPSAGTAPAPAGAAEGKAIYDQKCAGCHTIGGGRSAGPDLKGITGQRPRDWLIRFIVEPDKLIASGDPTAKQLVQEWGMPMPPTGVNSQQAEQILAYIDSQSGGAAPPAGAAAAAPPPGNAATGRALFTGERGLAGGGPACAACHSAAGVGGTWGAELTHAHSRTGPTGLASIMKTPPFPAMRVAYASRPLVDSEIADVVAYFAEIDGRQAQSPMDVGFPLLGLAAFAVLVALSLLAWRNRTPPVRRSLGAG